MELRNMVKSVLPAKQWRLLRRATNRMRWLLKLRLVRHYGYPIMQNPMVVAKYVLWDPEVESYTYDVANLPEIANFLAPILSTTPEQVLAWFEEARTDQYLARDRGFHWSAKRYLSLGNRLMYYPVVRAIKPRVIVEAGVHEGLASEMFLAALRRNAAEGHPGKLISLDIHEDTGWLVHPDLRSNWQRVMGSTMTHLDPALEGLEVDLFLHDTPHMPEVISHELNTVMRHAGPKLTVIDSSGLLNPTLREYCDRLGTKHNFIRDIPKDHVVKSHGMAVAMFDREMTRRNAERSGSAETGKTESQTGNQAVRQLVQALLLSLLAA